MPGSMLRESDRRRKQPVEVGVEQPQLTAAIEAGWLEHRLNADSVDQGDDEFGLSHEIELCTQVAVCLCSLEHDLDEASPYGVALALFGGEIEPGNGLAPEGKPYPPLGSSHLVERKAFFRDCPQRGLPLLASQRMEHARPCFARRMTQGVDQHLALVSEVVNERASRTARLVGNGAERCALDTGSRDGATSRGGKSFSLDLVINDLRQESLLGRKI